MFAWVNQYSYVLIAIVLMILIGIGATRIFSWKVSILILVVLLIAFTVFLKSQSINNDQVKIRSEWDTILRSNSPVVLQLYSEYWIACISMKPAVDRLEKELSWKVTIVRLDVMSDLGNDLKNEYEVPIIPTFIFFEKGKEIRRIHRVPTYQELISLSQWSVTIYLPYIGELYEK